jgi:hypothetical protein
LPIILINKPVFFEEPDFFPVSRSSKRDDITFFFFCSIKKPLEEAVDSGGATLHAVS